MAGQIAPEYAIAKNASDRGAKFRVGEVAHLVQYVLGQSPPQEFIERLTQETGGNPLIRAGNTASYASDRPRPGYGGNHKYSHWRQVFTMLTQARMQTLSEFGPGDIVSWGAYGRGI